MLRIALLSALALSASAAQDDRVTVTWFGAVW